MLVLMERAKSKNGVGDEFTGLMSIMTMKSIGASGYNLASN